MSEKCTSDCSTCGKDCGDRRGPGSFQVAPNPNSHVKKVIGVISGKGGVGKSTVTAELAVAFRRQGLQVGIMDADITGPSIPKAFGLTEMAVGTGQGLYPVKTKTGIDVMSMNLLLEDAHREEMQAAVNRAAQYAGNAAVFAAANFLINR